MVWIHILESWDLACSKTKEGGITIGMDCKRIGLFEGKIGHRFELYVVGVYPSNIIHGVSFWFGNLLGLFVQFIGVS
jgi:hypothetical protein